jgi:hypothetical protein
MGGTAEESAVAKEAFQQALDEGLSERDAMWQAENAVRDEFGLDYRGAPGQEEIGAAQVALEGAIEGGASAEEAVRSVLSEDSTWQEVDAVREATWQSFDQAWQGGDTGTLSYVLGQADVGGPRTANDTYLETLSKGGSAQDAWQTAQNEYMQSALGARGPFAQILANQNLVEGFPNCSPSRQTWVKALNPEGTPKPVKLKIGS